jgi:hypothetical protein
MGTKMYGGRLQAQNRSTVPAPYSKQGAIIMQPQENYLDRWAACGKFGEPEDYMDAQERAAAYGAPLADNCAICYKPLAAAQCVLPWLSGIHTECARRMVESIHAERSWCVYGEEA